MKLKIISTVLICAICFYAFIPFSYADKPKLTFHSEPCHNEQNRDNIDSASIYDSGVDLKQWKNKDELLIIGHVVETCKATIADANYYLEGDTLILAYSVTGVPADCVCTYPVTYSIKGLPKKDYEIVFRCERRDG